MSLNGLEQKLLIESFKPLLKSSAKVLILGSIPGQASLDEKQYYAHPRNAFWWIMSELFNFNVNSSYQKKKEYLFANGIAIWDVLAQCERKGSLDSNIKIISEKANPISEVLLENPSIKTIAFNGKKAAHSFDKYIKHKIEDISSYKLYVLPSTSPANAVLSKQQKLRQWQSILQAIDKG